MADGWVVQSCSYSHRLLTRASEVAKATYQGPYQVPKSEDLPSELSMDIDLSCHGHTGQHKSHTYHLYTTSFLGLGANEARKRYVDLLLEENKVGISTLFNFMNFLFDA